MCVNQQPSVQNGIENEIVLKINNVRGVSCRSESASCKEKNILFLKADNLKIDMSLR